MADSSPESTAGGSHIENEKRQLEFDNMKSSNAKLALEVLSLQPVHYPWVRWLAILSPLVVTAVSFAGFWFGAWQYFQQQKAGFDQRSDDQRRETARLLWDKQL